MRLPFFGKDEVEGTKWDAWIGERIRQARLGKNWTQAQLAKAIYKSQGNVSDLEHGNIEIGAVDLMLIAINLEQPITFFYPPRAVGAGKDDLKDKEKQLIHYIDEMSEDMFDLLLHHAKTYRDLTVAKQIELANQEQADFALERSIETERKEAQKRLPSKGKKSRGKR